MWDSYLLLQPRFAKVSLTFETQVETCVYYIHPCQWTAFTYVTLRELSHITTLVIWDAKWTRFWNSRLSQFAVFFIVYKQTAIVLQCKESTKNGCIGNWCSVTATLHILSYSYAFESFKNIYFQDILNKSNTLYIQHVILYFRMLPGLNGQMAVHLHISYGERMIQVFCFHALFG